MKRRAYWHDPHRAETREWLISHGFSAESSVGLSRAFEFFTITFEALDRHPLDMGCDVIIGYEHIGVCETLADVQMVYDTIRRINGEREG